MAKKTRKSKLDGEVDYLATPQPEDLKERFKREIESAYLLEHGCQSHKEIGDVIRSSESSFSQFLSGVEKTNPVTIRKLIHHLSNPLHKQRIFRLWSLLQFDFDPIDVENRPVVRRVSGKTLVKINGMIGGGRLRTATKTAWEAFKNVDDEVLAERLLDKLGFLYQRLDELGRAMSIARLTAERAVVREEPARILWAKVLRVRLLLCLPNVLPENVDPLIQELQESASGCKITTAEYLVFNPQQVPLLKLLSHVIFVERGLVQPDDSYLRRSVDQLKDLAARSPVKNRHTSLLLAARIHLLFNETFMAQELLENSAKVMDLKLMEGCAILMGRILSQTDSNEASIDYLTKVRAHAERSSDLLHAHVVDRELALREAELF